jgi:hypothetical protein
MLTCQDNCYALTSSAATYLVRGRPAFAGDLLLAWIGHAIVDCVGDAMRTVLPAPADRTTTTVTLFSTVSHCTISSTCYGYWQSRAFSATWRWFTKGCHTPELLAGNQLLTEFTLTGAW